MANLTIPGFQSNWVKVGEFCSESSEQQLKPCFKRWRRGDYIYLLYIFVETKKPLSRFNQRSDTEKENTANISKTKEATSSKTIKLEIDEALTSPPGSDANRKCFVFNKSKQNVTSRDDKFAGKSGFQQDNQGSVKSVADKIKGQRLDDDNIQTSNNKGPSGDFSGLIGKAKEGLSSGSRTFQKKVEPEEIKPAKSEAELRWEQIESKQLRPLKIKEMDFTDLTEVDDVNYLDSQPTGGSATLLQPMLAMPKLPGGMLLPPPPPPPPMKGMPPPPPPPPSMAPPPPPPSFLSAPPPPPGLRSAMSLAPPAGKQTEKDKGRRTLKLHWRESKAEFFTPSGRTSDTIWSRISREIGSVKFDRDQFAELFESRTTELKLKVRTQTFEFK